MKMKWGVLEEVIWRDDTVNRRTRSVDRVRKES
jgi:hypothetical protein